MIQDSEYADRRNGYILGIEDQVEKYNALDEWFKTPQGICVAHAFSQQLDEMKDILTGRRLIQLGCCGDNLWLKSLKYRQKCLVSPCFDAPNAGMYALLNHLPFEKNSVDCVIAPLTLEAFGYDKNPIDEIDRVLKPMGHIIFFGINPWSFWGAALKWGRLSCFGNAYTSLSSSLSIKLAMFHRGYQQCFMESFYYIPPVADEQWIQRFSFFNEMGKMIWPFPAGFYCFVAQKHQPCTPNVLLQSIDEDIYFARA